MNLKTAVLIAIIGMVVHLAISFLTMADQFVGHLPIPTYQALWLFNTIIFNGCMILFFTVFYAKQKE
jgi:hypothetical protein